MIGREKARIQHALSAVGQPVTGRSRQGDVGPAQSEISAEEEVKAQLTPRQAQSAIDSLSYHPLHGPRETD